MPDLRLPAAAAVTAAAAISLGWLAPAAASSGSSFVLGATNTADRTSTLTSTSGPALALHARDGAAPLTVDSSTEVRHLNAARVGGLRPAQIERAARSGLTTTWQLLVRGDGSPVWTHEGTTVRRDAPGSYVVTWTGFPGLAFPYCSGIGRAGVIVSRSADGAGTGSLRVDFNGVDTRFSCLLAGLTG